MTSPNNIIETRKEMARLNQWGAALELTIAETQCELEVVEKLKSANAEALDALMAAARRAGRRRVTLDDIKGCDTQREVLRFVVDDSDDFANSWSFGRGCSLDLATRDFEVSMSWLAR